MITVKISELLSSTESLQKLSLTKLKAKLAWQVSRLIKAADREIQDFNDARMNLIKKYGEKDESGELITDDNGNCKIIEEGISEFTSELNELLDSEVEINGNKIKIEDLGEIDFTPAEMATLETFIEFDE